MKYAKNTLRKNLTITKYSFNSLELLTSRLPLTQSAIIDTLMLGKDAQRLIAFVEDTNNPLTGLMYAMIAEDPFDEKSMRELQRVMPEAVRLMEYKYIPDAMSGAEAYITGNVPKRLMENERIKAIWEKARNHELFPFRSPVPIKDKDRTMQSFIRQMNTDILSAKSEHGFTEPEYKEMVKMLAISMDAMTFIDEESDIHQLYNILAKNGIFHV